MSETIPVPHPGDVDLEVRGWLPLEGLCAGGSAVEEPGGATQRLPPIIRLIV